MDASKIAIVTGCNKGIGRGIVENLIQKTYTIVMACRNLELADQARKQIIAKYEVDESKLDIIQLDVGDTKSIDSFVKNFAAKWKKADILVNNAGIATKGDSFDSDIVQNTFKTNFYGTIELSEKMLPFMNQNGKIVTLGSRAGKSKQVSEALQKRYLNQDLTKEELFALSKEFYESVVDNTYQQKGFPKSAYGMSKLGINSFTRILARTPEAIAKNIQVYTCCPGYVNTDMTSGKGVLTIEQGCMTPLWLIDLPLVGNEKLNGLFFYDQQVGAI